MARSLTYQASWTRYAASLFSLSAAPACSSAAAAVQAQVAGTEAEVRRADSAFWKAYNGCDERAMAALFTKDVEFYHDRTGLNAGRAQVAASMMRGPCADSKASLRREAVADTIRFDSLAGGFALLSGEHRFLLTSQGKPELPSGLARFTSIWQRVGGAWQMRRIVSYAHGPDLPKLVAVPISSEALAHLAGDYAGEGGATAHVRVNGGVLTLASGGADFKLTPIGLGRFGVTDRLVQFVFADDTVAVIENGTTVANMRRVK